MPLLILRACASRSIAQISRRRISTLSNNPHIYVFPAAGSHVLSFLPSDPPTADLAVGTSTAIPPTPDSFTENPKFLSLLQIVLQKYAYQDPGLISQAQAFASTAGSSLGSGGAFFPQQRKSRRHHSGGGGAGGAGRGGWVHLSDGRNPPDYGRIAWPEDIFGSLQVDGEGRFVGENGDYHASGTYRIVTREGILGLSDFLRDKVIERLQHEEKASKALH